MAFGGLDKVGGSVAVGLVDGLVAQLLHFRFRVGTLGVLEFHDVRMFQLREDAQQGLEVDVGITGGNAGLGFGDGDEVAVLRHHGEGESVDIGLALLLVPVGGIALQALGNIVEVGAPVALPETTDQRGQVIGFVGQVHIVVGAQDICIDLLPDHLVGYHEARLVKIDPVQRQHPEIVQQAQEVVRIRHRLGREAGLERAGDPAVLDDRLQDGGIMGEFLVTPNEHPDLRVVRADVVIDHIIGDFASMTHILVHKIEDHIRVEQFGIGGASGREAVVVVPGPHDFNEFICRMMEFRLGGIVFQHLPHLRFRETDHPIEPFIRGIVGPDVEAGGQVIHRDGAHPRDVHPPDSRGRSVLDRIIERAERPVPMCLRLVVVHSRRVRQDRIREVVVLVDEKVHLPAGFREHLTEAGQDCRRSPSSQDVFLRSGEQQIPVGHAETLHFPGNDVVHPGDVSLDAPTHCRKTDPQHQVRIPLRRGMVIDVQPLE